MNPFYARVIGSLVRAALVAAGGASLSSDQVDDAAGAAMILVGIGWSLYEKYNARLTVLTALASPIPMTEAAAKVKVADGLAPSLTTAADEVPQPAAS